MEEVLQDLIIKTLKFQCESQKRNTWIDFAYGKVYVRKSFRLHNGEMLRCFDIATIELEDEFRGQGFFKLFIDRFHKTNRRENIFFESVLNPKLYVYLTKFGFIPTGDKESLNLILLEYGK